MQTARNIYKTARENTGLTQEAAAECLYMAAETLRAYETGARRPSDDTVKAMARLYGARWLGYLHMQESPLADCLPQVSFVGVQEASMRIVRLMGRFARDQRVEQLLEIAEDGVIDEAEQPVFQEIMDELREIARSVLALGFCGKEKTPERVAAHSSVGHR